MAAAVALATCTAVLADRFETQFEQVTIGLTKAGVVAMLGSPDAESSGSDIDFGWQQS